MWASNRQCMVLQLLAGLLLLPRIIPGAQAQTRITVTKTTSSTPTVSITQSIVIFTDSTTTSTTTLPIAITITPGNAAASSSSTHIAPTASSTASIVSASTRPSSTTLSTQLVLPTNAVAGNVTVTATPSPNHTVQVAGGIGGGVGGALVIILIFVLWRGYRNRKKQAENKEQEIHISTLPPTVGSWAPNASRIGSIPSPSSMPTPPIPARNPARLSVPQTTLLNRFSVTDSDLRSAAGSTYELTPWGERETGEQGTRATAANLMNDNGVSNTSGKQPDDEIRRRDDSNPPSIQYRGNYKNAGRSVTLQYGNGPAPPITNPSRQSIAASSLSLDWKDNTSTYTTDWSDSGRHLQHSPEPSRFGASAADTGMFRRHGSPKSTRSPASTVSRWPDDEETNLDRRDYHPLRTYDSLNGNAAAGPSGTQVFGRRR